jgi:hypothetical protein
LLSRLSDLGAKTDRALRDAISEIKKAKKSLLDAAAAMSALNVAVAVDMNDFLDSYLEGTSRGSSSQEFDSFLEQLQLRSEILEICLFRAQIEEGYLILSDNQTKKHVVDNCV